MIEGVEVGITFREQQDGSYKVSVRTGHKGRMLPPFVGNSAAAVISARRAAASPARIRKQWKDCCRRRNGRFEDKKQKERKMNGILCINKPQEYTSFDVIARIRGMSKTKRVGHSGTLDPMATGVLPVFIGMATKACDLLPDDNKCYEAAFALGTETDTLDCWGTVKRVCDAHVRTEELTAILPRFTGEIEQIPPMYSAVRVNGQRLYDIARQGREIERMPRKVNVMRLACTNFDEERQTGTLSVSCSKGTYIRSIISDIGAALGCGAMMTGLGTRKGMWLYAGRLHYAG